MQSFLLFANVTFCAIVLLHLLPSENGLANAIPAMNGGDALLLRKKRQDEGEEGGGGDEEAANEDGGGDEEKAEGEGEAEEKGEDGEEEKADGDGEEDGGEGEGGDKEKEGDEDGGGGKGKGGKGGKGKGGGGAEDGGGQQPHNNDGNGGGGGGTGGQSCTDKATGCEPGYCSNVEWARQHCAGTCKHVLSECGQAGPDQSKSCSDTASNCGTIPDICVDDNLSVCGCAHMCNKCQEHQSYMSQGMCKTT